MPNLYKFSECQEWVHNWIKALPEGAALRHMERAAAEQRRNFEACDKVGRFPSTREEYLKSVELLERTVSRLRSAVERAERAAEEKEIARRERGAAALAARMRRERLLDPRDHDEPKGEA